MCYKIGNLGSSLLLYIYFMFVKFVFFSYIFRINQQEKMLQIIWLDTNELLKDPHPPKGQKDPHPPT